MEPRSAEHSIQLAQDALNAIASLGAERVNHFEAKHRDVFNDVTMEFAHGRCAWFALAAAEKYGLPLAAVADDSGKFIHVMCRVGERYFDAYGLGDEAEVLHAHTHMFGHRVRDAVSLRIFETNEQVVRNAFLLSGAEYDVEIHETVEVVDRIVAHLGISFKSASRPRP